MFHYMEDGIQQKPAEPAYGSFVSVGSKSVLANQSVTWSYTSMKPLGMRFMPNGCYIYVDRPGVYQVFYTVILQAGREGTIYLTVNDVPQMASKLRLPSASGQVGAALCLPLNSGDLLAVATSGRAITLNEDTNAVLTLHKLTELH